MLKAAIRMQDIDIKEQAVRQLHEMLKAVPFLKTAAPAKPPARRPHDEPDAVVAMQVSGSEWTLICEVRSNTQLRHVRAAIYRLRHHLNTNPAGRQYGVLIGPYISPEAARLLREESLGFLDLAGNCFLSFDGVYIERSGRRNPFARAQSQRSLFAPKSSRALMVLLNEPRRTWKVIELSVSAGISLGQASNVGKGLIDREWGCTDVKGFRLTRPDALLEAWRANYEKRVRKRGQFHTSLHGRALDAAVRAALKQADDGAHAVLASFSAAQWSAPFASTGTLYFYADEKGEEVLREYLRLGAVSRGGNVIIEHPSDNALFAVRTEPAVGMWSTNLVQTYLELSTAGERGAEAADHLRASMIAPRWAVEE